jgi:hypothetical protein
MNFLLWLYRWLIAAFCVSLSVEIVRVGDLSFVHTPHAFVKDFVFLALAACETAIIYALFSHTFYEIALYLDNPRRQGETDRRFERLAVRVLATQVLIPLVLVFAFSTLHHWLTEILVRLVVFVEKNAGAKPLPMSIVGWWGPAIAIAAGLLNTTVWSGWIARVRATLRAYGSARFFRAVAMMAWLRLFGPRADFFEFVPVVRSLGTLTIAAFLWADAPRRWAGAAAAASVTIVTLFNTSRGLLPPAWLFLSSSDFRSFQIFRILRFTWPQHGITLLDRFGEAHLATYIAERHALQKAGGVMGFLSGLYVTPRRPRVWSMRTRDKNWKPVLFHLMRNVPLIVADLRSESPALALELRSILYHDFVAKTVLIGDPAAGGMVPPAILNLEGGARLSPRVVSEDTLRQAVWYDDRLSLPSFQVILQPERVPRPRPPQG